MRIGRDLREARERAGLSQRELARRSAVAQPNIARIESGDQVPRVDTLDRLLRACDARLEVTSWAGRGVDRSQIRELLGMTPLERIERLVQEANALEAFPRGRLARSAAPA